MQPNDKNGGKAEKQAPKEAMVKQRAGVLDLSRLVGVQPPAGRDPAGRVKVEPAVLRNLDSYEIPLTSLGKRFSPGRGSLSESQFFLGKGSVKQHTKSEGQKEEVPFCGESPRVERDRPVIKADARFKSRGVAILTEVLQRLQTAVKKEAQNCAEPQAETAAGATPERPDLGPEEPAGANSAAFEAPYIEVQRAEKRLEQMEVLAGRGRGRPPKYRFGEGNPPPFTVVRPISINQLRLRRREEKNLRSEKLPMLVPIKPKQEERGEEQLGKRRLEKVTTTTRIHLSANAIQPLCVLQKAPAPDDLVSGLVDSLRLNLEKTARLQELFEELRAKQTVESVITKALLETGSHSTLKKVLKWSMKNCLPELIPRVEKQLGLRLKKKTRQEFENELPPELKPVPKAQPPVNPKPKPPPQNPEEKPAEDYPNLMVNRALLMVGRDIDRLIHDKNK